MTLHNYSTCGIQRLGIVRIQQLDQFPRQRGSQFNKNPLNMDLGSIFNWAQIYLTPAIKMKVIYNCIIDCIIHNLGKIILMICLRFHAKMK